VTKVGGPARRFCIGGQLQQQQPDPGGRSRNSIQVAAAAGLCGVHLLHGRSRVTVYEKTRRLTSVNTGLLQGRVTVFHSKTKGI